MDATGQCGPLRLQNEVCHLCSPRTSFDSRLFSAEHTVKSVSIGTTASSLKSSILGANSMIQACTMSDTTTTAVTNSKPFNVGIQLGTRSLDSRDDGPSLPALKATFSAGATWGWSDTYTNAVTGHLCHIWLRKSRASSFSELEYMN